MFGFFSNNRTVQSVRVVPTEIPHIDYPGAYLMMFGPAKEGPTDFSDAANIIYADGLAGNVAWHPTEGGMIINGFVSKRRLDQEGTSTILMHIPHRDVDKEGTRVEPIEGAQTPMGLVTPLGDGSFRIDLFGGFFFEVTPPNDQLHPNCHESWRDMYWDEYLEGNPISTPKNSRWNRNRDWVRWFVYSYLGGLYFQYIWAPVHNWRVQRKEKQRQLTGY